MGETSKGTGPAAAPGEAEMNPSLVDTATQFLIGCGAGSLATEVPEMRTVDLPEDSVELRRLMLAMDEARVAFDRRFAEGVDGAVGRLTTAVREVRSADRAPFMPGPSSSAGKKP